MLVAVLACKTLPPPPAPTWVRVDEVPVSPNLLARDKAICEAKLVSLPQCRLLACYVDRKKLQKRDDRVLLGCMAERGWVPEPVEGE